MTQTREQQRERTERGPLVEAMRIAGCEVANDRRIRCPFHQDHHASAEIKAGKDGVWRFRCYAATCGFSGDVYDVRAKIEGKAVGDVLTEARDDDRRPASCPTRKPEPAPVATDEPRRYASIEAVTRRLPGLEGVWVWRDTDGELVGWTIRYRRPGESKRMLQAKPDDDGVVLKGPQPPWPLLYLPKILAAHIVILCEGEPKADIINAVGLADVAGTSILGGRGSVLGAVLGALLVQTVASGVTQLGWPSQLSNLFVGIFIIIAVGVDLIREHRRRRRNA